MPSLSFKIYRDSAMKDIEKIFSNYEELKGYHKGRRSLDHLFRSGVLLLAAAFESYIEDVIVESANIISSQIEINDLPIQVKKKILQCIKKEKNELAAIELLAGDNWIGYYIQIVEKEVSNLNSPKTHLINGLMNDLLGIENLITQLSLKIIDEVNELDEFISVRGQIAHRLKGEFYLKQPTFKKYVIMVNSTVKEVDKFLQVYLMNLTRKSPWRDTYKNSI